MLFVSNGLIQQVKPFLLQEYFPDKHCQLGYPRQLIV